MRKTLRAQGESGKARFGWLKDKNRRFWYILGNLWYDKSNGYKERYLMRALHLCFWMHHQYELQSSAQWERGYFGGEASFRKKNEEEFQPFLALLERNAQRYAKLHCSLVVTGAWLEQAERWDAELIRRVKKLVERGAVELVATPYYNSMAALYNMDELKSQVEWMQEQLERNFGTRSEALALPELVYHNRLARWAEKQGYKVMLAGEARGTLDWRTVNRVYEAKGCENLRVVFENAELTREITDGGELLQTQQSEMEEKPREVFSARMLKKRLDLEFLRGDLVSVGLGTEIFAKWREAGVIGLFDELFKKWTETPGAGLVGVKEIAEMTPTAEISVKKTASRLGEAEKAYGVPEAWDAERDGNSERLYNLRENILKTRDRDLYVDFAKLTEAGYARGGEEFLAVMADVQKRLLKMLEDVEVKTAPKQSGMTASTTVRVNIDHAARQNRERKEALLRLYREANDDTSGESAEAWDDELDDAEAAIQVLAQRMKQVNEVEDDFYSDLEEAEVVEDVWMDVDGAGMPDAEGGEVDTGETSAGESGEASGRDGRAGKSEKRRKRKKIVID